VNVERLAVDVEEMAQSHNLARRSEAKECLPQSLGRREVHVRRFEKMPRDDEPLAHEAKDRDVRHRDDDRAARDSHGLMQGMLVLWYVLEDLDHNDRVKRLIFELEVAGRHLGHWTSASARHFDYRWVIVDSDAVFPELVQTVYVRSNAALDVEGALSYVTCDEGENLLRDRFDWRPAAVNVLATKYPSFPFRPLKDELIGKRLRPLVLGCGNSFLVFAAWRASFTARVRPGESAPCH
jgi:hypothetical protein